MTTMPIDPRFRRGMGVALQDVIFGPAHRTGPIDEMGDLPDMVALPAAPQPRSKFGSILSKLGELGEYISATQGNENAIRSIQGREQAQQQEALWSRRQQAEDAQWMRRQQWERDNRPPTYFEDNAGNRWERDPRTGENRMVFRDNTPKMNFLPDGNGGGRWVTIPGTGATAPPIATPITEDLWSKGTPIGGASQTGSRTFR